MMGIHFADPQYFWLLLIIPAAVAWYIYRLRHHHATLQVSTLRPFDHWQGPRQT
jgi:Ca-activated chloride channel family protein